MDRIYLDIESARSSDDPPELPPLDIPTDEELQGQEPASAKSVNAKAKWRAERIEKARRDGQKAGREAWERTSLEPVEGGRVLCVGIAVDDGDPVVLWGDNEKATLIQLQAGLLRYPRHDVVAYNGLGFDFPFIAKRALHHGLYPLAGRMMPRKRYNNRGLLDPMQAWQGAGWKVRGTLPEVAAFCGYELTDEVDGSMVHDLWVAGETDKIRTHVIEDVQMLRYVTESFDAAGWL